MRGLTLTFTLFATTAFAQVVLKDPKGDDNGPGGYTYPTDSVYKPGTFDLTEVTIEDAGSDLRVTVSYAGPVEDPWGSKGWDGNGFSHQMLFLFVDTDRKAGSGHKDGIPGLNVRFAEGSRWEKAFVITPQGKRRLDAEIASKAKSMQKDIVVPKSVRVQGRKIVAVFAKGELGAPAATWGYQAVVQSNEGYPSKSDLLTRPVNEIKGQHRFGGGHDFNCDPHAIDILAGSAKGGDDEKALQHRALKSYVCDDDNEDGGKRVELEMVTP